MSAHELLTHLESVAWRALVSDRPGELGSWKLEEPELARIVERHDPRMISYPAVFQLTEDLLFQTLFTKECLLEQGAPSAADRKKIARLDALLTAHGGYRKRLLERVQGGQEAIAPATLLRRLATRPCERLRLVFTDARGAARDFDADTLKSAVDFVFSSRSENLQIHYCAYEPRHFAMVRQTVLLAETAEKTSKKRVHHFLTFKEPALGAEELEFFRERRFVLVFSGNAPESILKTMLTAGVSYRVRAFGEGSSGIYEDFVRLAEAGHKSIQTCYDVDAPWSQRDIIKMLQEMERIAAYVKTREGLRYANLEGVREPVVLNDEVSLHADGDLFLALNLRENRSSEWPLHDSQKAGPVSGAKDIDLYQRTPFEIFHQLSRMQTSRPDAYRKLLLSSLRVGYALDGWLRRKRAAAGVGKLNCA